MPMASRLSGLFSVPYDPRDWAPGTDRRAAQARRARENAAEDGLASPPPPYSPASIQQHDAASARSSRTGLERSQTTSASQSPVPAPASAFAQRRIGPPSNAHPSNRHSVHIGSYLPPPPSGAPPMPLSTSGVPKGRGTSDFQAGFASISINSDPPAHPPSARRAVSASAGQSRPAEAGPSGSTARSSNWVVGMPLPGPPPGPPPPGSRSQSTSGAFDRPSQPHPQPRYRQTIQVSDLGPVPPTPSTWTEGQPLPTNTPMPLHVDTVNVPSNTRTGFSMPVARPSSTYYGSPSHAGHTQGESSSAANAPPNLSRSSAVRDSSTKGLRERRAQHRNSLISNGELNPLSVQTNPWADSLSNPNSGRQDTAPLDSARSAHTLVKASSPLAVITMSHEHFSASPMQLTRTPPISPTPVASKQQALAPCSAGLPAKSLLTPPLSMRAPLSAHGAIQHQKDYAVNMSINDQENFQREASRRHAEFLLREKLAGTDLERLQLFAEYVLQEATVRQKKYETTFLSGEFDIERFRSDLFRTSTEQQSTSNSVSHVSVDEPDQTSANTTPQTRPDTTWWKDYQPALSPIASMDYDEMSSRGRAPSRWWESQTGSQSGGGGGGRVVHRSKRESKYMGLSKEFLMAHSPSEEYPNTSNQPGSLPHLSSYPNEKANPEEFGYFGGDAPRRVSEAQTKKPETPALLDISRFITLPPPYPRHYPAVNNNHPDLAQYRTTVRTLSDLDEVRERKARHRASVETLRKEHKRKLSESRRTFSVNMQSEISRRVISYADAAKAEEAFNLSEFDAEKQNLKMEFDKMQDTVINPLHNMLHDRISQLNGAIQRLQDDLHTDARYQDPDQPQEAGDEKPELLEKLTQMKWLFDVREQIHRECFDLLSERNDKYKALVIQPYQFSNKADKVMETQSFFEQDAENRYIAYCNESLKRHDNALQIVVQHVRRGVELQSSAFWDIAPGLLDLLQKIPEDLRHAQGILIPDKEYKENPSYHHHPQQYLYSLLSHAEKSTYQYIEGQVNLQCLLHEMKTGLLVARYRAIEANEGNRSAGYQLSDAKAEEETALTAELKQKAGMIEEQWLEALGSQLQVTRERVKTLLQEDDAWDEVAAEDT